MARGPQALPVAVRCALTAHVMLRAPPAPASPSLGRVGFALPPAMPGAEEADGGVSKGT